jgi:hypothetical protein
MGFLDVGTPLTWEEALEFAAYGARARGRPCGGMGVDASNARRRLRAPAVRRHGVLQFLATFRRVKDRRNDVLRWGDEVRGGWPRVLALARSSACANVAWHVRHASGSHVYAASPINQIEAHLVAFDGPARRVRLLLDAPRVIDALKHDQEEHPATRCAAARGAGVAHSVPMPPPHTVPGGARRGTPSTAPGWLRVRACAAGACGGRRGCNTRTCRHAGGPLRLHR